ncbi:hypothetical protein HMPREF0401_00098 [Fusobacterium animalis 11_3_2]|uniref:Lipoprotein n=1 Tax=Fusobacterium animalis 11_3_2 TaxID=457403 RepID=F7KWX7_9FUSO|nr:hypothetical protein [Fusobacterium animalis]EGN66896.1 hypothetical protein HMPREF0401_00098 [Fusobacterium animalis 11_3_2]
MKSFLVLIILIFLTACTNTRYSYYPENYKNSDISISASLVEFDNESSPLSYIWIYDLRNHYRNRERESYHNIKILSSTVKINSNGKENIVHTKSDSDHIYIYDQGIIITGDFTAYIGRVQLDNGKIIDIPPLKFKKHVLIEKYSGLDDAFSKGVPRKEIFSGTVEDYKKQKK